MTKKELAIEAIRRVHANQHGTLADVLDDLEDIALLAEELCEAVRYDLSQEETTQ